MTRISSDKAAAGMLVLALMLNVTSASGEDTPKFSPGDILQAGGPRTTTSAFCRKVGTASNIWTEISPADRGDYFGLTQPNQGGPLFIYRVGFTGHSILVDEECGISSSLANGTPPWLQVIKPIYTYYTTTNTWACCKSGAMNSQGQNKYLAVTIGDLRTSTKLFQLKQPLVSGSATQIVYIFQTDEYSSSEAMIVPPTGTDIPDDFIEKDCHVTHC